VQDLINEGFRFGTYAGSKWIVPSSYYDTSATIEYRHSKGRIINKDDECEFNGFTICNYGSSTCIGVPIKIKTIEDLRTFCKFFLIACNS
jgi:hypothetical protein